MNPGWLRHVGSSRHGHRWTRVLLFVGFAAGIGRPAAAQEGGLRGVVLDSASSLRIVGASVRVPGAGRETLTDSAGRFIVPGLSPGEHRLVIERLGYATTEATVLIEPGGMRDVEIRLVEKAEELDAISVDVGASRLSDWLLSKGFGLRRARGEGLRFLAGSEVLRGGVRTMQDVLRRVPDLKLYPAIDGGSEIRIDPSPLPGGEPCRVAVYLNGNAVTFRWLYSGIGTGTGRFNARRMGVGDMLQPDQLDGLELYGPSYRPVAGEPECGVLLLWSAAVRQDVDEPFSGALNGTVIEEASGRPVAGAEVRIEPLGSTLTTDERGRFSMASVPPGRYELVVSAAGASPSRGELDIRAGTVTTVTIDVIERR